MLCKPDLETDHQLTGPNLLALEIWESQLEGCSPWWYLGIIFEIKRKKIAMRKKAKDWSREVSGRLLFKVGFGCRKVESR